MIDRSRIRFRLARFAATALVGLIAAGCGGGAAQSPSPSTGGPSATRAAATPSPELPVIALPTELPENATYDQLLPLYAYHWAAPFDIVERMTRDEDGIAVRDIAFTGASGQQVEAYLVVPPGSGPFPGILFEHMAGGNREQFVFEAVSLAKEQHAVSLLLSRATTLATSGTNVDEGILQVREMRRALDLLESQPKVDHARLAYVGHSAGAMFGAELLTVEPRVKTAVLMAPVPSGVPNFFDPAAFAPHAKARILFQFGKNDGLYSQEDAEGFAKLFAQQQVSWYDAGHGLNAEAMADRAKWFGSNL